MIRKPNPSLHFASGTTVMTLERKNWDVFTCLVDTADYHNTAGYAIPNFGPIKDIRWQAYSGRKTVYASAVVTLNGKPVFLQMHSLLAGRGADHRNGNGLDNRRLNLRPCPSASQQGANQSKRTGKHSSQYKGVSWGRNHWWVYITVDRKKIWVGGFETEEEAARAYDAAARKHFGEFASLNFPTKEELGPTALRKVPDRSVYDAEGDPIVFDEDLER
jgi:hypothetical protein